MMVLFWHHPASCLDGVKHQKHIAKIEMAAGGGSPDFGSSREALDIGPPELPEQ